MFIVFCAPEGGYDDGKDSRAFGNFTTKAEADKFLTKHTLHDIEDVQVDDDLSFEEEDALIEAEVQRRSNFPALWCLHGNYAEHTVVEVTVV